MFALRKTSTPENPIELQILAAGLPIPEPEYEFASAIGRKWAADYAWMEYRILLEIEGAAFGNVINCAPGSWTTKTVRNALGEKEKIRVTLQPWEKVRLGGRHNTGAGMQADCEKYSQAAILGWMVVRVTTTMIRDGIAIKLIEAAFAARKREGYPSAAAK